MLYCAPSRSKNKWTCFSLQELQLMSTAFNKTSLGRKDPIDVSGIIENCQLEETCKRKLWNELRNRFYPYCGDYEGCWLDNIELSKHLRYISPNAYEILNYFTLKPKATEKKNGWLSTNEIDYVMKQYEIMFPNFVYIGCVPSDYYKLSPSKFPKDVLDRKGYSAVVFNLDSSHQSGSHWIAVFFDNTSNKRIIEYFDPTGNVPNKNLKEFLHNAYFDKSDVIISKKKHQKGDTECGLYSMYYILKRLSGETMDSLNSERITDNEMSDLRGLIFRPFTEKWGGIR
jgi:hypothetical protein